MAGIPCTRNKANILLTTNVLHLCKRQFSISISTAYLHNYIQKKKKRAKRCKREPGETSTVAIKTARKIRG